MAQADGSIHLLQYVPIEVEEGCCVAVIKSVDIDLF